MKEDNERLKRIIEDQKIEIGILTEKVKVLTLENIRLMNKESRKHLLRPDSPSSPPHLTSTLQVLSTLRALRPQGEETLEDENA